MRRNVLAFAASVAAVVGSLGIAPSFAQPAAATLPVPSGLSANQVKTSNAIAADSWINHSNVDLQFSVQVTNGPVTPQVEIEPSNQPFTGNPNFTAPTVSSSGTAVIHVTGLLNGRMYHWAARVADSNGNASAWVPFGSASSSTDFGVDKIAPSRPTIRSSSNPNPARTYRARVVTLHWASHDSLSGIAGYTFSLQRQAHVIRPGTTTSQSGVRISNLSDGVWFLAIRAKDRAGNWSPTATYRIALDRTAPEISWLSPKRQSFNPFRGKLSMQFKVNEAARGVFTLYRVGSKKPVSAFTFNALKAGQVRTIVWSGRGPHGNPLQKGYYFFSVRLTDTAKNSRSLSLGGIDLRPLQAVRSATGELLYPDGGKRIIVSLSRETLYAYDGTKLVQQTYVTTGNPSLPTPTGTYHVMAKYHPYEFISPWPLGSPYYYAPSWSQYAMLFRDGGYFLHDAPWRSAFGPGTNGPGQPGTNYGGTHGCVNIPPGPMLFLWNWTPVGTLVEVVP